VFENKRALVTGGTGSFGQEIVPELLMRGVSEVRVFSRDEEKQRQMAQEWKTRRLDSGSGTVSFILGDVRHADAVERATRDVDIVFHAAALKQVPSCERNVLAAVSTNVLGASNVIEAALQNGAERVVTIGTDKAVEPVSVMGMTKGLQERLFIEAASRRGSARTVFCTVRAGNVIGSRGSVVPLFKQQIEAGGPVTVTCRDMTRFLMSVREAVALAFDAAQRAVGGEIFVLQMPAVKLGVLAQVMIESLAPGSNIEVQDIGPRPGERMHELLVSAPERARTVRQDPFFVVLPELDIPETLEQYNGVPHAELDPDGELSSGAMPLLTPEETRRKLQEAGWLPHDARIRAPAIA